MKLYEINEEIMRLTDQLEIDTETPRQIRCLERYGFQRVGTWRFDDANSLIASLAANRWRVPYGINPAQYKP